MKKTIIALGVAALSFSSISLGAGIGDVSLRFCNGSGELQKTLSIAIGDQQAQDICMKIFNTGNEPATINLNFVDGTVTNDADQKKACKGESDKSEFGQYVTIENPQVTIPAGSNQEVHARLKFAEEVAGTIHGCATYSINNSKTNNGAMFAIQVRRANFIDAIVKGIVTSDIKFIDTPTDENNLSKNPKISAVFNKQEDKLAIQAIINNKGTAEQKVTIKGTIKNIFGYSTVFVEESRNINGKDSSNISATVDNLPFYKGPFTITYTINYEANIGNGQTLNEGENKGEIAETTVITICSASTYILGILLLLIIAGGIVLIIRKRSAKKGKKETSHTHETHHQDKHHHTKK